MPTEVKMPQLGESVVEGTVSRWLKQAGEHVDQYEPLLEVMTDKVDTEVPAPAAGIVREITVPEGTTVRIGTILAILDDGLPESQAPDDPPQVAQAEPQKVRKPENGPPISPVVARMAAEHQLDLSQIQGSGLGGRVTKQDVLQFLEQRNGTPAAPEESAPEAMGESQVVPFSPMRRVIAEHMLRSVRTAPHVTTIAEADLSKLLADRERKRADFERQGVRLTLTPYFVYAAAAALQAVPILNASYSDDGIVMHSRIHIGMAVALDEGLIVPVIQDAAEKNLLGLARAVQDLAERARTHQLRPGETRGGTFTITNHGTGGSLLATPIINQPQAAILGIGAVQKRAVVITRDDTDAIAIRPMCYLSLAFDHRLIDGATADRFLMKIINTLEQIG